MSADEDDDDDFDAYHGDADDDDDADNDDDDDDVDAYDSRPFISLAAYTITRAKRTGAHNPGTCPIDVVTYVYTTDEC